MTKENAWQEKKQQILSELSKEKGKVTVSKLQEKYSLSFVRAKEVYEEYSNQNKKTKFSNSDFERRLSVLYKTKKSALMKLNPYDCYIDKKMELLSYEYNLIRETNSVSRVVIAILLKNKLEEMKIPFYITGNFTSSYFGYLFGIHGVDTLRYNVKPEMCYGLGKDKPYLAIDFHVSKDVESSVFDIVSSTLSEEYVYNVYAKNDDTDEMEVIPYKIAFSSDDKTKDNVIVISEKGKDYKCLYERYVWDHEEIVEINMIADIDQSKYRRSSISFDDIDKKIEETKKDFVFALDYYNELGDDVKESIAKSIHSSYDLLLWWGLIHNSYYERKIPKKITDLEEVVFRDDIYNYLLAYGIEKEKAYHIATMIRKGRYIAVGKQLEEEFVSQYECKKYKNVKYLFPKGHALAVVLDIAKMIL